MMKPEMASNKEAEVKKELFSFLVGDKYIEAETEEQALEIAIKNN